jgi:HEAT repeat protein
VLAMRARILAFAAFFALCVFANWGVGQTSDAKKKEASPKDGGAKLETIEVTADTKIAGKNLDQWIKQIANKEKDRSITKAAIEAIVLYGPELAQKAVPVMIAELKKHNPPNATLDMSVRTTIPQPMAFILSNVKTPNEQDVKDAVAALKKMLKDPQVIVRLRVTQALQQMGPMAKDTAPELAHLVIDPSSETWELREVAVVALGTVAFEEKAPLQKQVPPALFSALKDPAVRVRMAAIQALNILQNGQDAAFKQNLKTQMQKMATNDLDPLCKVRADMTIYTTLDKAPEKKKQRDVIAKFLDHKEPQVRVEAAQGFGLMGEEAKDQVPHLIKLLNDSEMSVVAMSVMALAHIKDRSAVPQLQRVADNAEMPEIIRNTAKEAIEVVSGLNTKKDEPKKGADKQ